MSLASMRSVVVGIGVALCAVAIVAWPARSWALHRSDARIPGMQVGQNAKAGSGPNRGQYPDADIQIIEDYSASRGSSAMIRVHMDILAKPGANFDSLKKLLSNPNATAKQISAELHNVAPSYPRSNT